MSYLALILVAEWIMRPKSFYDNMRSASNLKIVSSSPTGVAYLLSKEFDPNIISLMVPVSFKYPFLLQNGKMCII